MKPTQLTLLTVCAAGATLMLAASAKANLVQNGSFEDPTTATFNSGPITDWTITGTAGVWNPSTFPPAVLTAPDGVQVGYINGGFISQNLGLVQANTTYDLSIDVGGRADGLNPGTDYSIALFAGSTLITSVTPVTPTTSIWTPLTSSGNSGLDSGILSLVISSPGGGQLDFDNVSVTAVPEASTVIAGALLLLPFGMSAMRGLRKQNQQA